MGAHSAQTTPGGNGQFDVFVDDELVFSKRSEGCFPEGEDVLALL